jgi:hypothetical protein
MGSQVSPVVKEFGFEQEVLSSNPVADRSFSGFSPGFFLENFQFSGTKNYYHVP